MHGSEKQALLTFTVNQGEHDYKNLPSGTPTRKGNLAVGHGGTYAQVDGGLFGKGAQYFLRWLLCGEADASDFFTGNGARQTAWTPRARTSILWRLPPSDFLQRLLRSKEKGR
jgi:hypothetical protein